MSKVFNKYFERILIWQAKTIDQRRLILILSLIIGIITGLTAVLLKNIVHFTGTFLLEYQVFKGINYFYLALPLLGILLTVLYINYFIKEDISHGISKVLAAISRKGSYIKSHNTYSSVITSTATVGFGGSVGLEAPVVYTGAAIGSNLSKWFNLNYKTSTLLLACGAAGAIGGIFKAPIAATIFALEVLMVDLTMWAIIPLLISAVSGASISALLMGSQAVFSFTIYEYFPIGNIPWYIILGVVCGVTSLVFNKLVQKTESRFERIQSIYKRAIIGGLVLGLLIFLFPPLFGEGYISLKDILGGNPEDIINHSIFAQFKNDFYWFIFFLAALIFTKIIAVGITTGSGGIGGVFAPSLFVGGIVGFLSAQLLNKISWIQVSPRNFALIGMAGIMSAVMHAPLTSIFLIAEITGGYSLFIPLIITSTISYLTIKYFDKHSIYTKNLAIKGELITHNKDQAILTLMNIKKLIENDFSTLKPHFKLGEIVDVVKNSKRNVYPVLNDAGELLGIIHLNDIRHLLFSKDLYQSYTAINLMVSPQLIINHNENLKRVINTFEKSEDWNLPVLENGKYIGFISKSQLLNTYRKMMVEFSDD